MARPPASNPSRPRATAHSFPKPNTTALHTPSATDNEQPPVYPYPQPIPTPPYSSTEDFSAYLGQPYPQPTLLPPPTISPHHTNDTPTTIPSQYSPSIPYSYGMSPGGPFQPHSFPPSEYFPSPTLPTGFVYDHNAMFLPAEEYVALPTRPETIDVASESEAGPSTKPHTPRPPNAWILYRSDMLRAIGAGEQVTGLEEIGMELGKSGSSESSSEDKPDDPKGKPKKKSKKHAKEPAEGLLTLGRGKTGRGLPQADISKMISMLWKREKPEIRAEYEAKSEAKKQEHALLYPGYKFQPQRKADKIKQREEKEREKEAVRREKELQRSGGRRRTRTRTRNSPTAPYSVLTPSGDRSMARSLTYAGHEGARGDINLVEDDQRFRSYPFPMPQSSLPSMRPDEVTTAFESSYSQTTLPHSTSTPNLGHVTPPSPPMASSMPYQSSPMGPPPMYSTSVDSSMPPPSIPRRIASYTNDVPSNGPSPDDLVSLWSAMPDGKSPLKVNQPIPQTYQPPPMPYQDTFNDIELRQLPPPPQPGGWVTVSPNSQQQWALPPDQFDDGLAYLPMVNGDGSVPMPVLYASDPSAAQYADHLWATQYTIGNDDAPLVLTSDPSNPETVTLEAVVYDDDPFNSGPFLSEGAVFTPSDIDWALTSTEPNTPTSPSEDNEDNTACLVPRYVSASAFPVTPQSNSQALPGMTWNDRSTSFAFADAFSDGLGDVGSDMIDWMVNDDADATTSRVVSATDTPFERRSISTASGYPAAKRSRSGPIDVPSVQSAETASD